MGHSGVFQVTFKTHSDKINVTFKLQYIAKLSSSSSLKVILGDEYTDYETALEN